MALLFRWLSRWPLSVLHAVGGLLGWSIYILSPTYRRRFNANVQQARLRWRAALPAIAESGRMLAELPYVWLRGADDRVTWENDGLLRAAIARGKGVMLLTPHMGCFEVAGQSCAERYGPITVLYRPARKAWMRDLVDTARPRHQLSTAPATLAGVRQLLRVLRRGGTIGLLPDQVPPDHMGIWAPFFGKPAYTMTLAARLARQVDASVLLLWCERLPNGRGYVVHVAPFTHPAGLPQGGGASGDRWSSVYAEAINHAMEGLISQRPQQYLWAYDRYKQPRTVAPAATAVGSAPQ